MIMDSLRPELRLAVQAAQNKKAAGIVVLDLSGLGAFTDAFLLCTGFSTRQVQAVCDEVEEQLARRGLRPRHREGSQNAEWVLLDFGGLVVHVFTEAARRYYDLERLWRSARRVEFPDEPSAALPGAAVTGALPR